MKNCSYPNCETTAGCRGACHEAALAKSAPAEMTQLADWIREGKLTFVHCGTLGAMDASAQQHDRIEAALRMAAKEECALVPKAALRWLFGEGPDANGMWFGECEEVEESKARRFKRAYWWRSKFRQLISDEQTRST